MNIIEDGQLKGAFRGFKNRETVFEFTGGRKWQQNEYKYNYYYSYRPNAKVISESSGDYLVVDGMNDRVLVKRA